MAGIWRNISITWNGKEYVITPTLSFINHLEQRPGNSLSNLILAAGGNKLGTVRCAELLFDALKYADADVKDVDEVWLKFEGISPQLTQSATMILASCLPTPKKDDSEGETSKKPQRRTAKK